VIWRTYKNIILENDSLKRYLDAKYFSNLNLEVEHNIFRTLWKFVFRSEDEKPAENREINFRALYLLYEERSKELNKFIEENKGFFSEISGNDPIYWLIEFLSDYPTVF